jgi:eukaryotic-like serine/threonine-protein kinase
MKFRERLEWLSRLALILFVLASVAFLSALMAMRFAIQGREVTVPDVVGKDAAIARQILGGRGIGMKVEDRIYANLPPDAVVRQSPQPNMSVKTGQNAHVVLSLGPRRENIPQLVQMTQRAAQIALLRGGMQVGEITSAHLPGEPVDTVLQQDPAPGATDVTSPHVNLLVSLGPPPPVYVMPGLVDLPFAEAESKLSAAGLRVAKVTPVADPEIAHGAVAGQSPPRGQRVDAATAIDLQVAE